MRRVGHLPFSMPLLLLVVLSCQSPSSNREVPRQSEAEQDALSTDPDAGVVIGEVRYRGDDPDMALAMKADPICRELQQGEVFTKRIVVDDAGRLANTFVYVSSGLEGLNFDPPTSPLILNQENCRYSPHVAGMMVGQTLVVRNSDPTLHNVHVRPKNQPPFSHDLPFEGLELETSFERADVMIEFASDVHPWMRAYLGVLDHPFFTVSDPGGSFRIEGLPAGNHRLEAWHEELGVRSLEISLREEEATRVTIDFSTGESLAVE